MAEQIIESRETVTQTPTTGVRQQTVASTSQASGAVMAARVVSWLTSALLLLLALRLVFAILGANQANMVAQFIYGLSYPFVAPFFGLFGYTMRYGVARFEVETLVAIIIYGGIGYGLARLLALRRTSETV